jgi:aspartyl/asparaginyl-tRNA synthetase
MISRVLAGDLHRHVGEQVRIAGWLHRRRELKAVTFLPPPTPRRLRRTFRKRR